ncbi:unnamed protein product [Soboliphyme baturini]|uniref:Abhydrolase_3 domain-containing protein n=1 Tax=Soboliphyme baturini TaxID=241478 RepID=A0A183IJ79_9BILA|nr:unnamed protein product [Soboliphyme baturini]
MQTIPYGSTLNQIIEFFGQEPMGKDPLFVYIHGGYWQVGSPRLPIGFINNLISKKMAVACISYDLAPEVSMAAIVHQVTTAVRFINEHCEKNSAKSFYLCGHSAGAHLCCMVLLNCTDAHVRCLEGLILLSGIYSLSPICGTYIAEPLQKLFGKELHIAVGEFESNTFKQNSKDFYLKVQKQSHDVHAKFSVLPGVDHFTLIETLDDLASSSTKYIHNCINCSKVQPLDTQAFP